MTDIRSHHISPGFDAELEHLTGRFQRLGGLAAQQLQDSLTALAAGDRARAEEIYERDREINERDVAIDRLCMSILARRQPAATDLRLVTSVGHATFDLERIGDEAAKIARICVEMSDAGISLPVVEQIQAAGEMVLDMLRDVLDAFARLDSLAAYEVARRDALLDASCEEIIEVMLQELTARGQNLAGSLRMLWIPRALERIGDHSCNLAEHVVFVAKGEYVRHMSLRRMAKRVRG